jgi:hypothetical protein
MFLQKLSVLIATFAAGVTFSYSQKLYSTITPAGKPVNVQGMMVGDDIFLSMQVEAVHGPENLSVMVEPDGEQKVLDLSGTTGYPIVAGVKRGDSTCFYYLSHLKKSVTLSTLLLDSNTAKGQQMLNHIPVPGVIYGSYVEGDDLFMLCGVKNEYKLRLLQIRNGRLKGVSEFPLTFNLGKRKNQRVTFIDMANPVTPVEAAGDVKICKDGRAIWILIDEPFDDKDVTVTSNSLFRTTAIRLDLDAKTSIVKSFYQPDRSRFTSAVLGNDIYRLVYGGPLHVDQFDFYSGKKKNTAELSRGKETRYDSTYARISNKCKTEKSVKGVSHLERWLGAFLIVDSLSNGERIFTVGDYGDNYSGIYVFGGAVPAITSLIITASSLIVGELVEGQLSTVYYYFRGSMDSMAATYDVPLLRKKVDDFDNGQLKNKRRFNFRGYLVLPESTFEISQQHKSNTIEIRKFELTQPAGSSTNMGE